MERSIRTVVYGNVQMTSPWFSNKWRVLRDGNEIARVQRLGRIYSSVVALPDGSRWLFDPHGNGVVRALDDDGHEFARIVRRSWLGRRWDIVSPMWNFELASHARPRSWGIEIGGAPAAELKGSLVSYNHVVINAMIGVPLAAVLLGWHVIARPWEAIAEPTGLLPVPRAIEERRAKAHEAATAGFEGFGDTR